MLHDVHCHLDLFPRPEMLVKRIEAAGVFTLAVSNTPAMYRESLYHLSCCRFIKPALGLHPLAEVDRLRSAAEIAGMLGAARFFGEIGLDRHSNVAERLHQEKVFRQIAARAGQQPCLLSVHSRGMEKLVLQVLRECRSSAAILHWYTGPAELIREFVADGHYFSVNLLMLAQPYSRRIVAQMPPDRVLTESDGPFTEVGGRPLSPLRIAETVSCISHLWSKQISETEQMLEHNLETLIAKNGVQL